MVLRARLIAVGKSMPALAIRLNLRTRWWVCTAYACKMALWCHVLGSIRMHLQVVFGGFASRVLQAGDVLEVVGSADNALVIDGNLAGFVD